MRTNVSEPTKAEQAYLDELCERFANDGCQERVYGQVLVGITEIKLFFGLPFPSTVANWQSRAFDNLWPDPIALLKSGPVYDIRDIVEWYINWKPRQGIKVGQLPDMKTEFPWLFQENQSEGTES